jgi:uncharacterized protein (TIGR00299 family) protein
MGIFLERPKYAMIEHTDNIQHEKNGGAAMKTLYLDCSMGAAGDMLMGALLELYDGRKDFLAKLNGLGLPGISVASEPAQKCGICGTHVRVTVNGEEEAPDGGHIHPHGRGAEPGGHAHAHDHEHPHAHPHPHEHPHEAVHVHVHDHEHTHAHEHEHPHEHAHTHAHHHASYADICGWIGRLALPEKVRAHAEAVYRLIGEAESHAHGAPIEQIHFHEVGSMDALADVVGCCWLFELLGPDQILASPVHVGSGTVRCAHGILPVPAPATAHILTGVPCYGGEIQSELCTPTGAALLKHFVSRFGPMPVLTAGRIGYGMGTKDFPQANCVRALLGETGAEAEDSAVELCCNLDDMTPEALGFACEALMEAGALDVFTLPAGMKKFRSGTLLTILCRPEQEEALARLCFLHTSTRGIRRRVCSRRTLVSHFETVETPFGRISLKISEGYGVRRVKPEYADVAKAAREHGVSFEEVQRAALKGISQ